MNPKMLWIGLLIIIVLIGGLFLFRPEGTTDTEITTDGTGETSALTDGTYALNTEESVITWTGRKPKILGYEDSGTFMMKSGAVTVVGSAVASGDFVIDMDSLAVTTTSSKKGTTSMLENHLRSDDFFSIETYPEARFVITSVVDGMVTGDLTIKNKTAPITFPATVRSESSTRLVADAAFVMDRTTWDVRYGSDNFFDNLGDNLIADEVQIKLLLVATK